MMTERYIKSCGLIRDTKNNDYIKHADILVILNAHDDLVSELSQLIEICSQAVKPEIILNAQKILAKVRK